MGHWRNQVCLRTGKRKDSNVWWAHKLSFERGRTRRRHLRVVPKVCWGKDNGSADKNGRESLKRRAIKEEKNADLITEILFFLIFIIAKTSKLKQNEIWFKNKISFCDWN